LGGLDNFNAKNICIEFIDRHLVVNISHLLTPSTLEKWVYGLCALCHFCGFIDTEHSELKNLHARRKRIKKRIFPWLNTTSERLTLAEINAMYQSQLSVQARETLLSVNRTLASADE